MKIRYYPFKYMENIPLTVPKHIDEFHREDSTLEITVIGKENSDTIDLDNIRDIAGRKVRNMASMGSYGLLEALFIFGIINALQGGFSWYSVYLVLLGTIMVVFIAYMVKSSAEKYMYGGFTCPLGEVYFQNDEERALFNDVLSNIKGKKKKFIKKKEEVTDEEKS